MGGLRVGDRELPPGPQAVLSDQVGASSLAPRVAQPHRALFASVLAIGESLLSQGHQLV